MCLAVPGRITEVWNDRGTPMATISFDGIEKEICLAYLPAAAVGEYAIVHAGFAISQVDEEQARVTLQLFADIGLLADELGSTEP